LPAGVWKGALSWPGPGRGFREFIDGGLQTGWQVVLLQMLLESCGGYTETGRDVKSKPAQADETHGFRPDCFGIDVLSGIQRDDSDLTHDINSLCTCTIADCSIL